MGGLELEGAGHNRALAILSKFKRQNRSEKRVWVSQPTVDGQRHTKSLRQLARECGVSHESVRRALKAVRLAV